MKKYPFIKQQGIKDCGPACLLMIIKYYKGYVPLDQLCDISKTTKYGTDAYHLVSTASELGFRSKGLKLNLNEITILPVIAHLVIDNNYGHYVVIYEINLKKGYLIIGDPAIGIKKIKMDDFIANWDNIIIELIPERVIPIISKVSLKAFLINIIKSHKKLLFVLLISSFIITIFSCFSSFYFRFIIESINKSKGYLTAFLILFIIINIFKIIMSYLREKIFIIFQEKIDMDISCNVFNSIVDLPYRYYKNKTTGEIISRFDDLDIVRQILYRIIISLFSDMPFILGSLILLFCINLKLTLLVLIVLIIYISFVMIFIPILKKYIASIQEESANINSFMTETIEGFETVSNCSLKENKKEGFSNKYYKLLMVNEKFAKILNIRNSINDSIYQIGIIIVIYLGALLAYDGKLAIGTLVMFYSVFISFSEPLKNIIELNLHFNEAKSALQRMLEILIKEEEKGVIKYLHCRDIKFNNLKFYYNDVDMILDNINLNISSGQKVLILGKSGSGKSTLLKLLLKYYDSSNSIFINNIDINKYTNESIKKSIGYISQQEYLFTDSIIDNLGGDSIEEVLDISKICEIDNIMKLRNLNFNSIIEENGFNLSGGERQRVILGRLLLKHFDVLLIDEGLNQMDVNLERRILKRIFKKYKDKIIIIVSHRLDNMDLYNHVIELDNGKIIKDVIKNV